MHSCAVFANIYDTPLGDYQKLDIITALEYLYSTCGVNTFFLAESRHFEHLCRHFLDGKKNSYMPPETYCFPGFNPYDNFCGDEYGNTDIFFADFILCDETTVNFVKSHMGIKYIVELPKTKIYIMAKES